MEKKIIFIFGCQRSGTTATIDGLKGLEDFKIFDEVNERIHKKTNDRFRIRLKPIGKIRTIFKTQKESIIVVKPLVESQNALRLLNNFDNSCALWLFRDYKAVINSMLTKWGENVGKGMIKLIANGNNFNWRSEKFNKTTRLFAKSILNFNLSSIDEASLFWYFRNLHFYNQKLQKDKRICLVKYSKLVSESNYLSKRLAKVGFENNLKADFYHNKSIKKGENLVIHPIIHQLCIDMIDRLNCDHFE